MRILTRYLALRFLANFAVFLIVSTLVIVIVEMMLNLGDMLTSDSGPSAIFTYLLLRIPAYYLRDLVPIVAFASAFFTLAQASRWLEVLAIEAGGISPFRIAAPVLVVGLGLVALTFVANETVVLQATRLWNSRGATDDGGMPITFRQGSFWYHRGRTIYNIGDADRETRTLRGVRVFELDTDGRLLRSIASRRAELVGENTWTFLAPLVRTFDPDDFLAPPKTTLRRGEVQIDLADATDMALMNADVSTLTLRELRQTLSQSEPGRRRTTELEALLHARLAEPFSLWVFVLTAVSLGVRVDHAQGLGMVTSAFYGIAVVATFFGLQSFGSTLTGKGLLTPGQAPWSLLALFLVFGLVRFARIRG